ncbi:MAG: carboxypeptidase regulatory-like domain-containing protein [Proteobacteria bacterium]|nr:carboxypeptidase regulatory-like domain-containing protein [Pseudomonadota bacterium]MCP4917749.1 carboxypeptidase regulatory-like domain-containing protein [Pseudomonadota bacterium]
MAPTLLILACTPAAEGWVLRANGVVLDLDGLPVSGASVELSRDGGPLGSAVSDEDGRWRVPVMVTADEQVPVRIDAELDGRVGSTWSTLELFEQPAAKELFVGSGQTLEHAPVPLPAVTLGTDDDAALHISLVDGTDGTVAPRVPVELRAGWNAPASRPVVASLASDGSGLVEAVVPAGVYTAHIVDQSGWADTVFPARTGAEQQGVVLPPIADTELAIALHYEGPVELDLHVTGPRAGTGGSGMPFDVWSGFPAHPDRGDPVAALEIERDGLELTRVYERRDEGVYRAVVFDADGALLEGAENVGNARPIVQIWSAEGPSLAQASPGEVGTSWVALRLDLDRDELQRPETWGEGADPNDPESF